MGSFYYCTTFSPHKHNRANKWQRIMSVQTNLIKIYNSCHCCCYSYWFGSHEPEHTHTLELCLHANIFNGRDEFGTPSFLPNRSLTTYRTLQNTLNLTVFIIFIVIKTRATAKKKGEETNVHQVHNTRNDTASIKICNLCVYVCLFLYVCLLWFRRVLLVRSLKRTNRNFVVTQAYCYGKNRQTHTHTPILGQSSHPHNNLRACRTHGQLCLMQI